MFYHVLRLINKSRRELDEAKAILLRRTKINPQFVCLHCGGDIRIRNPKGYCDHLYYPENCNICQSLKNEVRL